MSKKKKASSLVKPTAVKSTGRDIVVTRVFDAPRALVWKAWTEPEHLKRWWGPRDFTSPVCRIDLRVGGTYLSSMRSPGGQTLYNTGVYREIVPLERLVYSDSFADEQGNVVPASHYGMDPDFPLELPVTVTFEDQDGKTKMTLRHAGLSVSKLNEMTVAGWNGSFDKLAASLKQVS
jgi:uncharacterized protein YndB with AHSA1/START domain